MENPEFLKAKYGSLHASEEVESAAKRTEIRTGEKVGQKPAERIQNYLDRFKEIIERKDPEKRERGLDAVKQILYKEYVIDPEIAADEYIERQKRMAREQGHGDIDIPEHTAEEIRTATKRILSGEVGTKAIQGFSNEQKQMVEEVVALVEQQGRSLDQWMDYLASPDATYPDWLKYWAIRNVTTLAEYNKDKKAFPKRTANTTNPFPDLNREALAYVLDAIEKKYKGQQIDISRLEDLEEQKKFAKLLEGENFAKLYAWAVEKVIPTSRELLTITEGKWVRYAQGSDYTPLVKSIQPHGTGWCTAGESTAESQYPVVIFMFIIL